MGINFLIILADRLLYLNQSSKFFKRDSDHKNIQELNNIDGSDKAENAENDKNFKKRNSIKNIDVIDNKLKNKDKYYDLILSQKFILHILVLLELTILIYVWYPIQGSIYLQRKTGQTDIYNYASNNSYILILNGLFCGYLYFSALQIRYGYSGFIKKVQHFVGLVKLILKIYKCFKMDYFV